MVIISNNPKFILNTSIKAKILAIVNIAENYKTNHSNTKGGTLMFYLEHESQAFKAIE